MDNWKADKTIKAQAGQIISDEVFYQMRDCVPPETLTRNQMQAGEAYTNNRKTGEDLYATFENNGKQWIFTGYKPSLHISWQ